ncbi:hypothetical protein CDAR_491891 [Caerostris darwini]|uniref:Uncharacterized protein n=1 Tax=Caerostris darwini TaxID=1538125 RepID=A0AAV4N277_9ARAC|nr:hypothetical protein CDAR_491891 [Caerostris darwini]
MLLKAVAVSHSVSYDTLSPFLHGGEAPSPVEGQIRKTPPPTRVLVSPTPIPINEVARHYIHDGQRQYLQPAVSAANKIPTTTSHQIQRFRKGSITNYTVIIVLRNWWCLF